MGESSNSVHFQAEMLRKIPHPLVSSRRCPNGSILCRPLFPKTEPRYPGATGIALGGPSGPAENMKGAEVGAGRLGIG